MFEPCKVNRCLSLAAGGEAAAFLPTGFFTVFLATGFFATFLAGFAIVPPSLVISCRITLHTDYSG
jgi:hypothetical protein